MTEPSTPAVPLPALPPAPAPPPSPVAFPLGWLLDHAAAPIQYRATIDVARLDLSRAGVASLLPYNYEPALMLALMQNPGGGWGDSMLGVPSARAQHFEGVGTINAVRRLIEYGWDRESPPLAHARRLLFRLLAEDQDPSLLFELAPGTGRGGGGVGVGVGVGVGAKKINPAAVVHGRALLREAAAAALAQAGYEGDPRLRGAARRIITRIGDFLASPLGEKPFVRVGNKHVLPAEAAPPSIHALTMLAHMPLFRAEYYVEVELIYHAITQPVPRAAPVQLLGKAGVMQPQLVLGDMLPHRNAADADVPFALMWLELMARLGFLDRNEGWSRLFERFLDDRDSEGVWHPHKGMATPRTTNPFVWPSYPLKSEPGGDEKWTDVTFRLGLIARLAGRPIELL